MPVVGGGLAIGGGLVGAIGGSIAAGPYQEAAQQAQENALKQWLAINVPSVEEQRVELEKYRVSGQLSPKLQKTFEQSPSNLKNMQIDPASRAAEVKALTQMQNIGQSGGLDAESRQIEQEAINKANTNEQGQRGAIIQNYAARGMGGAGAELAAKLMASQGDANQAAQTGMQSAANAEQRSLQAMTQAGQMGSNLNAQDYTQAAKAAEAQDAINKFNTNNRQNIEGANVLAQNQAESANLQNQQDIANRNTGVSNTQETHNKGLYQQNYENQLKKAAGVSGAYGNTASQNNKQAENEAEMWGGIGSAISQGGSSYGQYANNKKNNGGQ